MGGSALRGAWHCGPPSSHPPHWSPTHKHPPHPPQFLRVLASDKQAVKCKVLDPLIGHAHAVPEPSYTRRTHSGVQTDVSGLLQLQMQLFEFELQPCILSGYLLRAPPRNGGSEDGGGRQKLIGLGWPGRNSAPKTHDGLARVCFTRFHWLVFLPARFF